MDIGTQIVSNTPVMEGISYFIYILAAVVGGVVWTIRLIYSQFKKLNEKMDAGFKRVEEKLSIQSERLSIIETRLEERGFHDFRRNGTEEKANGN